MKPTAKALIVLAMVFALSFLVREQTQENLPAPQRLLLSYTTTSTRTANVNKLCAANLDRTTLVSASDFTDAQSQRSSVNSALGIDGNSLLSSIVNGNSSAGTTMITNNVSAFGIFVGVFAVVFILIFILWPFLCCCCTCPYCCPSKCCQKAEDEQYSKCQLYWPATVLILSLLLIIGASVYGFMKVSTFGPAISNMGCAVSIFVDDVLNGNTSSSGTTFFTGLNTLTAQLTNLNNSLASINGNFSDLANNLSGQSFNARSYVNSRMTDVKQIPDATNFVLTLAYPTPIDSNPTTGTLTSTFVNILGSYTNSSSLVGALYSVLQGIYNTIDAAKSGAISFSSTYTTISSALTSIQTSINSITTSITNLDNSLGGPLGSVNSAGTSGNTGLQAFYGVFIGFGALCLLGTLLTCCCGKYGCRHLIYFSCFILFLVGLLGALLSTLFSIFVPALTWGCSFMDVTLTSQAGFTTNLASPLGASVANQLSPCMPFGDGNIIKSIASGSSFDALNNLTSVISTMGSFNNTQIQGWISGNLTTFVSTVSSWCKGQISDLDSTNYAILERFANPSYSSWTNCNSPFSSDSWVPSNSPNTTISTYISCKATSGNKGDATTCTTSLTNNGSNTCGGCMDSTMLQTIINPGGTLLTQLNSRYGSSCGFNTPMRNVWVNYYDIKNPKLGPATTVAGSGNVMARTLDAQAKIINGTSGSQGVFQALNIMDTLFSSIKTSLTSIQTLTDPTYGLLAGLNCKIFGQDFLRIEQILCGSMYSNIYTMRLAFGICAWGVLFMMCCSVCTGVRHFKHMSRKDNVGEAFMKNSFDDASGETFKRRRN